MSDTALWDPHRSNGGLTPDQLRAARIILWKGHCSAGVQVIVHPECRLELCKKADAVGSTERLIKTVEEAPEGTMFAAGTEIHLVNRMSKRFAPLGKESHHTRRSGCLCTTMFHISPQHLAWALENLVEGRVVNRILVNDDVKHWARVALGRMLEIQG